MNSGLVRHELRSSRPVRAAAVTRDPDSIELRALLAVFVKRWKLILGTSILAAMLVYVLTSFLPPSYTARAKLVLDARQAQIITDREVVADLVLSEQVVNGEMAILRSNLLIEDVISRLDFSDLQAIAPFPLIEDTSTLSPDVRDAQIEGLVWAIRDHIKVYAEPDSYVIGIEATVGDPLVAMRLANTLAERYITLQVEGRQATVESATVWLEERLGNLEAEVAENEEAISVLRTDSLLQNGGTLDNAAQQITTLNNQLVTARSERATAEAQVQLMTSMLGAGQIDEAAAVASGPNIAALRAQALVLRQQDARWAAEDYGPDHPRRAPILADLDRVQAEIATEVGNVLDVRRSEYEVARLREQSLQANLVAMEEQVVAISRGEIGLRQLQRQAAAARQTYETLLARLTETRTQQRLQKADAKLIEKATMPSGASAPRPQLMAGLTGSVVFALAALVVFLGEMTATTFRNAREILTETGLPVLATLPVTHWKTIRDGIADLEEHPFSAYAERVRQLRTTVLMRDESSISTSLMILSSAPGEGKTMTALALAELSARAGKSVIVVDCDLRRSTLQHSFGWRMPLDIADYVTGRCALEDAIYSPAELPFDVLAGNGPRPDIAEELSTVWLRPTVEQLKTLYDVVIIDGPALLAVSDAIIVARAADKRLYLIEHDSSERSEVREGLSMLDEMGLGLEGAILNKSPEQSREYYSYDRTEATA